MNFNIFVFGIGLAIQLAGLIFFAGKLTNRIDSLEKRVTDSETDIKRWQEEVSKLTAIDTKLQILTTEVLRIRDSLDQVSRVSKEIRSAQR